MDKKTLDAIMRLYGNSQEKRTQDYIKYMNPDDRMKIMFEANPDFYYIEDADYLQKLSKDDNNMLKYINNILGR